MEGGWWFRTLCASGRSADGLEGLPRFIRRNRRYGEVSSRMEWRGKRGMGNRHGLHGCIAVYGSSVVSGVVRRTLKRELRREDVKIPSRNFPFLGSDSAIKIVEGYEKRGRRLTIEKEEMSATIYDPKGDL